MTKEKSVIREYQRTHESLEDAIARLMRKYGQENVVQAVQNVVEGRRVEEEPVPYRASADSVTIRGIEQEYDIPKTFINSWVEIEVIPVLHKASSSGFWTYIDRAVAESARALYWIATDRGIQPKRFLRTIFRGEDV